MARANNIRADIERIRGMSAEEFAEKWGDWARAQDKDLNLVRQRWIGDLERMMPYAEREEAAVEELTAAKTAYADGPTDANRDRRTRAIQAVQAIRAEERTGRTRLVGGDAFVSGG